MLAACLQTRVSLCDMASNAERALRMAEAASDSGARILVLPELFMTGFCYEIAPEGRAYPSLDPFREISLERGCLIMGSIMGGKYNFGLYNYGFCIEGKRMQLRPKIHPFVPERAHFLGGDFIAPVLTGMGRIGLEVCYDLRFPEVARTLALQGADMLVTVAQFPSSRLGHWRMLSLARAVENQMPHLACNWADAGGSMIIDAWGNVVAEAEAGEKIVYGEIDLKSGESFRREVPCFEDRRPEVYGCGREMKDVGCG